MPPLLFTLFLGLLLGIKHAFEADHVLAVSTIASGQKNPFKAAVVGAFWGIGHTTTLFIIGIMVLLLRISIPESLGLLLEGLAGVMLIILGIRVFKNKSSVNYHKHTTPFLIGLIHGLAGSGVLMILVLSTITELITGLYYILLFGIGSIIGMSLMSFLIGIPFSYSSSRFPKIETNLRLISGSLSIIFGLVIIYQIILDL
ncbi:hypothetical protein A3C59_00325 [Candidatus Daviesbacteria bacterium RIFCSPHIGHO2_02_FULL_36_13]|uniref:Urease accessory protein UreH n=1 Tax=Candidatus Daviesbacteria bacterium RIFCSPHIGHO2_02_FULL_36_13 TaxID=1797768 RepID=A0A1F5JU70_9BACT|nr:MAG: hypothetical protein A3C59_00325 [Candidatus Daviesbacteria bacterium RIFCSPHIGHO2_02_FULL_36_13]OGE41933.1 MAG: hypothetical protein A3A45_00475 [Candidatus Daviesbacteria bacterium RIFCSPLOWO2_01_FULL_36_8]